MKKKKEIQQMMTRRKNLYKMGKKFKMISKGKIKKFKLMCIVLNRLENCTKRKKVNWRKKKTFIIK